MRIAPFILANMEAILMEWEVFARGLTPGAKLGSLALRDNAEAILLATVADMNSVQSTLQQSAKARGHGSANAAALNGASESHATGRLGAGFDLMEVVSEYRALRSVLRLWAESRPDSSPHEMDDFTRFNESIDQSLGKVISSYTMRVEQARDMYLAILSHDLRNPLNSIAMSAQLLPRLGSLVGESHACAQHISSSAQVMGRMIGDFLDYTRTRLGAGMPVVLAPMDLQTLGQELFEEFQSAHPSRVIHFSFKGDLHGKWDSERLRQALSNLMGNAIQHGSADTSVELALAGEPLDVLAVVSNGGPPIAPGEIARIFDPLVRGSSTGQPTANRPGSIGVESRCGAVGVGQAYLLPALSVAGASVSWPCLRFHIPLIEPDGRI